MNQNSAENSIGFPVCNSILAVWQTGKHEDAYSLIQLEQIEQAEIFRLLHNDARKAPLMAFRVLAPRSELLQAQFPRGLWLVFESETFDKDLADLYAARKKVMDVLKLAVATAADSQKTG